MAPNKRKAVGGTPSRAPGQKRRKAADKTHSGQQQENSVNDVEVAYRIDGMTEPIDFEKGTYTSIQPGLQVVEVEATPAAIPSAFDSIQWWSHPIEAKKQDLGWGIH